MMLSRMFGQQTQARGALAYEEAKALARDPDPEVRRALATREDVRPEVLYFLAEDAAPAVRRAIAANPATPGQANVLLAADESEEVRADLARKIGRLLPDLDPQTSTRLREMTIEAIEALARDQLPRVRALLAEALKSADNVPRDIVRRLAQDVESIVAVPILEYSPLLSDDDLLEIIASGTANGGLAAIARRSSVAVPVANAIVATLDVPAVAALLANPSAQIREETLDAIIDHAESIQTWHEPLVLRSELSVRAMRRICQFVGASLVDVLVQRHQLPPALEGELKKNVRHRIETAPTVEETPKQPPAERVATLHAAGLLNDECLAEAVEAGEREFALLALARLSGLPQAVVNKIIDARSPKAVTSLAWKAGLSMRSAMRLQLRLAKIPPKTVMNARDGVDFPLAEADMEWQIDCFGG
jgi:uncharacterized protein (DUF2336 family)